MQKKSTENVAKSLKFCTLAGNRGRRIEWQCFLHRKFTNNRFCACAVQMLLKMAENATVCSTFEVQYGILTSTRTTAIRHFRATLTGRVISRMRTNSVIYRFYRAMLCIRGTSHGPVSVRLSVCVCHNSEFY